MLTTIPGVSSLAAEVIVSEIGIDMSRFKTEGHLISWCYDLLTDYKASVSPSRSPLLQLNREFVSS
jgi:hypothetical protein